VARESRTIYQAVYHGGKHGLTRQLAARLRTGRPLRKRRRRAQERTIRFVAQGCLIDFCPVVVGPAAASVTGREI
jgi:transposase, IS30 family